MIQRLSVVAATAALLAGATRFVATQGGPGQAGVPALEYDLSGRWVPINHEDMINRTFGGELGDYAGLPLNDAARLRAESYSEDQIALVEFQCRRQIAEYGMRNGLATLRIMAERDSATQRVSAFHISILGAMPVVGERTIYVDGRPSPPAEAPHSWGGFSTGVWNGNMLTVTTTHLKAYALRRPGIPASDERTITEHWVKHGDVLEMILIVDDPIFLTEPLVWSQSWARDEGPAAPVVAQPCHSSPELPSAERRVPSFLPGSNVSLQETAAMYGVPLAFMRGGAELMYPEYRKKMTVTASTLERCKRNCGEQWDSD